MVKKLQKLGGSRQDRYLSPANYRTGDWRGAPQSALIARVPPDPPPGNRACTTSTLVLFAQRTSQVKIPVAIDSQNPRWSPAQAARVRSPPTCRCWASQSARQQQAKAASACQSAATDGVRCSLILCGHLEAVGIGQMTSRHSCCRPGRIGRLVCVAWCRLNPAFAGRKCIRGPIATRRSRPLIFVAAFWQQDQSACHPHNQRQHRPLRIGR